MGVRRPFNSRGWSFWLMLGKHLRILVPSPNLRRA